MSNVNDAVGILHAEIGDAIEKTMASNPEFEMHDIVMGLLMSLGDVLINIHCPECRKLNKESIEKMLPSVLRQAMKYAASLPQVSEHVH